MLESDCKLDLGEAKSGQNMAISRRQIISAGHQQPAAKEDQQQQLTARRMNNTKDNQQVASANEKLPRRRPAAEQTLQPKQNMANNARQVKTQRGSQFQEVKQQQVGSSQLGGAQTESSDGYVVAGADNSSSSNPSYEEYMGDQDAQNYRHFDPYSIYSEEEDVWYSEERIFEVSTLRSFATRTSFSLSPKLFTFSTQA